MDPTNASSSIVSNTGPSSRNSERQAPTITDPVQTLATREPNTTSHVPCLQPLRALWQRQPPMKHRLQLRCARRDRTCEAEAWALSVGSRGWGVQLGCATISDDAMHLHLIREGCGTEARATTPAARPTNLCDSQRSPANRRQKGTPLTPGGTTRSPGASMLACHQLGVRLARLGKLRMRHLRGASGRAQSKRPSKA